MKESLRLKDDLSIMDSGVLKLNHTSARMIGEITIDEVDPLGNVVFSSTEYNDITIGGATFILEQMFKKVSSSPRFNLTNPSFSSVGVNMTDDNLKEEKIIGFMVGIGGEDGVSVAAPSFNTTELQAIPFRMCSLTDVETESEIQNTDLYMCQKSDVTINSNIYKAFYVKKFSDSTLSDQTSAPIEIISEYTDGSGEVTGGNIYSDSPIYTYAKVIMEINEQDVREYFSSQDGTLANCKINQLGLVAGYKLNDITGAETYEDLRLVTVVNFKGRDLSNTENTLRLRYKIYCM